MSIKNVSKKELEKIVKSSNFMSEVTYKLGYGKNSGTTYETVRNRCRKLNIDFSHLGYKKGNSVKRNSRNRMTLDILTSEILIKNSSYKKIESLKTYLIRFDIKKYECSKCGNNGVWNDIPLTLQLNHINGDNMDHRIENIEFLCPNCHTQTSTYGSRNFKLRSHSGQLHETVNLAPSGYVGSNPTLSTKCFVSQVA